MRIALIYTGYLRTWERCFANHRDNIYTPECDAFFYTYEDPEIQGLHDLSFQFPVTWTQCPHPFYDDPFARHKFDERKRPETTVHQVYNMMHNNLVGFSLVPKGYDFYVRIRPDISFNGKLDFRNYEPKENTIYIPQGMDFHGINDQFAFGDYNTMRKYYSVYLNCTDLWNEGTEFNSEIMHLANLKKQGIEIVRFGSPQHDLVR